MARFDPALLRARREKLGLSVDELATRTGYDRATLWRIEAGKSQPRPQTLANLAKALTIGVDELSERGVLTEVAELERTAERLSALVDAETTPELHAPASSPLGPAPPLNAHALENIYTAYAARAGERYGGRALVKRQAAMSTEEAAALGVAKGAGARFALHLVLRSKAVLDVTAHAVDAAVTKTMQQARVTGRAKLSLRVVVIEDDVFAFFGSRALHPWTFLIEAAELAPAARAKA
jgi:transcriptional regulator with XRE-family HTH domain